ncbi:BF3164 family lipoprotein [Rhodocaloribacter sp.]
MDVFKPDDNVVLKISYVILLLVLLANCKGTSRHDDEIENTVESGSSEPILIKGDILCASDSFGVPVKLEKVQSYLVILDAHVKNPVHIIHAVTGEYIRRLGSYGKGPGEFTGAWSFDRMSRASSKLWIYDLGLRRMTLIDLEKVLKEGPANRKYDGNIIVLRSEGTPLSPLWLGDTLIVSPGLFPKGRLAYFTPDGIMTRVAGVDPPGPPDIPVVVRQHAYRSTMKANADRTILVLANRFSDRLEFYKSNGDKMFDVRGDEMFDPIYGVGINIEGNSIMKTGENLRYGYVDLSTTRNFIYALYSGRKRSDFPGAANWGNTIHVFTWSGKLLHSYKLDRDAIAIVADDEDGFLYSASLGSVIMRYNLKG